MVSTPPRFGVSPLRRHGRRAGAISEGNEPHTGGAEELPPREVSLHVSLHQPIDISASVTTWSMIGSDWIRTEVLDSCF
jgi:hypothetical protein